MNFILSGVSYTYHKIQKSLLGNGGVSILYYHNSGTPVKDPKRSKTLPYYVMVV